MKKKIKYIGIVLVILFCCYNLFWYFGSYKPYNEFQKDFPEIEESGVKIYTDKVRLIPLTQMISTTSSVKQTLMIAFIKCMIR